MGQHIGLDVSLKDTAIAIREDGHRTQRVRSGCEEASLSWTEVRPIRKTWLQLLQTARRTQDGLSCGTRNAAVQCRLRRQPCPGHTHNLAAYMTLRPAGRRIATRNPSEGVSTPAAFLPKKLDRGFAIRQPGLRPDLGLKVRSADELGAAVESD